MKNGTLGAKLIALKERSGLSLTNIAKAANYKNASSIQRYFSEEYDAEYLPRTLADRMRDALVGFGEPPITVEDIARLTEYGFMWDRKTPTIPETMRFKRTPRDHIEVNTSYLGGALDEDIIITTIIDEDPLTSFVTPEHLRRRSVEGIYVATTHMMPRYMPGDAIFYETERPAQIGRDVVLVLRQPDGDEPGPYTNAVIGVLAARSVDGVDLKTLHPEKIVRLTNREVEAIWPILTASDLLAPISNA